MYFREQGSAAQQKEGERERERGRGEQREGDSSRFPVANLPARMSMRIITGIRLLPITSSWIIAAHVIQGHSRLRAQGSLRVYIGDAVGIGGGRSAQRDDARILARRRAIGITRFRP